MFVFYAQLGFITLTALLSDQYLPGVIANNRVTSGIFIWFAGNLFSGSLKNTGAFEIYMGKDLVWSSLAKGRLPTYPDLVEAFGSVGVNIHG